MIRKSDALAYHREGRPGKIEVVPTKPLVTQRDLSLAYSPGVAEPCLAIADDPELGWDYTARGNLVAVVSNGTAVLGLGNIGAIAGKPVMEGKGCLFKKFADIDVFDIELDVRDPDRLVDVVAAMEPTFGGINLEDIKAPECFAIEAALRKRMKIPVFHDDQHGTAIISGAALLNVCALTGRKLDQLRVVVSGAGASAIACARFYVELGVRRDNITLIDSLGVVYRGRADGMNEYKAEFAGEDKGLRTRADALRGADMLLGLSKAGLVTQDMLRTMNDNPIIFALANPDPEITYADAKAARPDAIVATGRSDFPNQVNNVLGFPFIFRGALDVRAREINESMKIAAARAIAALAHEPVPDAVAAAYGVTSFHFGADYRIPKPLDPRVLWWVAPAVAEAAMASGVARRPLDLVEYRDRLKQRMGGTHYTMMRGITQRARRGPTPARVVFPEGDAVKVLRACRIVVDEGIARPVLLGREAGIRARVAELELGDLCDRVDIVTPDGSGLHAVEYVEALHALRCRKGVTLDVARRLIERRSYYGAMMVRMGHADGLVVGLTSSYADAIRPALQVLGLREGVRRAAGMHMVLTSAEVKFFGDATLNVDPDAETLADIAIQVADAARALEVTPRVAMISYSTFGSAQHADVSKMARAVELVRGRRPEIEIDGELEIDLALAPDLKLRHPHTRLTGPANVLVFPNLAAGNAAHKVLVALGGATTIGPILLGIREPVTVVRPETSVEGLVHMTAYTASLKRG
ncbi:MAG: NADP-dependent malic enzyme [Deltaproteobacteria bacterium]|nr:NADP-dependent malic enzyme [Deltaproteobacteria bacterium]